VNRWYKTTVKDSVHFDSLSRIPESKQQMKNVGSDLGILYEVKVTVVNKHNSNLKMVLHVSHVLLQVVTCKKRENLLPK
jgi:hypothetical protein